jgi:hypothetical protein
LKVSPDIWDTGNVARSQAADGLAVESTGPTLGLPRNTRYRIGSAANRQGRRTGEMPPHDDDRCEYSARLAATHFRLYATRIVACLIKAAVDKKKRVPGDQPIAWPKAEEASRALAQLPERKGGPCVSTVSIVCGPTGHLQGWARARSTAVVANGICRTSGLLF